MDFACSTPVGEFGRTAPSPVSSQDREGREDWVRSRRPSGFVRQIHLLRKPKLIPLASEQWHVREAHAPLLWLNPLLRLPKPHRERYCSASQQADEDY